MRSNPTVVVAAILIGLMALSASASADEDKRNLTFPVTAFSCPSEKQFKEFLRLVVGLSAAGSQH